MFRVPLSIPQFAGGQKELHLKFYFRNIVKEIKICQNIFPSRLMIHCEIIFIHIIKMTNIFKGMYRVTGKETL